MYFGGHRKGNLGRGAAGKVPAFGFLKRGGRVFTKVIPDASSATLLPIIKDNIVPDIIVYSDCWRAYNVLDVSEFNTIELTTVNYLLTRKIISTELRIFEK